MREDLSTRRTITVLIGTFEDIVLRGLRAVIEEDENLQLVSAGSGGIDLGRALERERPEVALINFGSLSRPAELRALHDLAPGTKLVVLANNPTMVEARQMIGFGATACLAKNSETRDVVHAIHLASRGMHVLPTTEPLRARGAPAERLTAKESVVLEALQVGRSNAQIAADLHLSIETVRTHARNIYRKLGVGGRHELISRQ